MMDPVPTEPGPPASYDVFISHAGVDRDIAVRLRQALVAAGLQPWASFVDIPVGAPYPEQIVRAIGRCRSVVLMVSTASMRSEHVGREVVEAVSTKKPLLPIYIEPEVAIPAGLRYYLQTLHRMKFTPETIEQAAPVIAAALRDPTAWRREATPPGLVERVSASRVRLWGLTFAVALLAAVVAWGLQRAVQRHEAAEATLRRDALPESLALLDVLSAERPSGDAAAPWQLRLNVTLTGADARFSALKLVLASRDAAGAPPETFDLTPVLAPSQVGGAQMLTAQMPQLGTLVTACLTLPHPNGGEPWRVQVAYQGERSTANGLDRITFRPTAAPRAAREDGKPCS